MEEFYFFFSVCACNYPCIHRTRQEKVLLNANGGTCLRQSVPFPRRRGLSARSVAPNPSSKEIMQRRLLLSRRVWPASSYQTEADVSRPLRLFQNKRKCKKKCKHSLFLPFVGYPFHRGGTSFFPFWCILGLPKLRLAKLPPCILFLQNFPPIGNPVFGPTPVFVIPSEGIKES